MAEAVVSVLGKLAVVLANEAQFLGSVDKKVERMQRELIRIKSCLIDAHSKSKGDERVQNWLNELRNVAYRIEDATDTFFLKVEGHRCIFQNLIKVCNKPKQLYFRHKLGNELDDIQNLLEEISKSRVTYGIRDLPLEDKIKGEAVKMPLRRATYSEVDENEVVGMQADKEKILELLRPEKTSRRAVISIVGTGGLGKTTLACMVYKSAQADFDYHIMLAISQQFSLTDLLSSMISKDNNSVPNDRDDGYYVGELKRCLNGRRYLIILDDVWTGDLWNELKEILPDEKNASRILMTTRLNQVAKSADSEIPPYELHLLNERESLDLLLKKVFPYKKPKEECPKDLFELALELSKKCKGLPLALIVLGGILVTKELAYPAWERVQQTMNWHSDGSSCIQILAISYDDMPYYLKACFQYLASFPEDYEIYAKRLIRMWVAEGFIPLEGTTTMEILAEECLEELAKRSMVQVLSRSANGLIKRFKVHDILHELAMHEATHENFVTVFSHASNDTKPNRIIRRASLQAEEKNSQFIKYVGRNTRSLLLFGPQYCTTGLHCSNFRLLKVLKIEGWDEELVLKSLDELIHLKYLGIRDCEIDLSSCSLHRMRSLETLDVRGSEGKQPCDDFWSIGTLRHVQGNLDFFESPLPKCIDLNHLQTLKWVTVEGACDWKLPNLRKLGIYYNRSDEWVSTTNLLQTLPLLVSLDIQIDNDYLPMEIVYPKAPPNYPNLQSLVLNGKWPENVNVEARLFLPHLVKLVLYWSDLKQNPMPELGKLNSLKKLCLRDNVFSQGWEGPIICPKGFPALQYLEVIDPFSNIKDLTVAQGVMPKLKYLKVDRKKEVHLPPELQHVRVEKY
ncbi:putative disease resistance RPP13-like protein 3 [Carex rostrata]